MKSRNKMIFVPLLLMLLLIAMMVTSPLGSMANQQTVELGTAESFAILAGTGITVAGPENSTTVHGDIGSHPTDTYTGEVNVNHIYGDVYLADADGVALQAKEDLQIAYTDAVSRLDAEVIPTELGGQTLNPGVYTSTAGAAGTFGLTGELVLHADNPNDAFIFQMGTTLITAEDSNIRLTGEATFCQVFWQVGSSATLGKNSTFVGHILAQTSITATTGATVEGQLLALDGAVTLDTNRIINDVCLSALSTGSLAVTKSVTGDTGDMTLPLFMITVTGPDGFTATRTLAAGETYTWENLAPGTYTVTEDKTGLSAEWTVTGEGTVEVVADETAVTTVTNGYEKEIVRDIDYEAELPKTGGNALLMTYSGLILFGFGLLMWRKRK